MTHIVHGHGYVVEGYFDRGEYDSPFIGPLGSDDLCSPLAPFLQIVLGMNLFPLLVGASQGLLKIVGKRVLVDAYLLDVGIFDDHGPDGGAADPLQGLPMDTCPRVGVLGGAGGLVLVFLGLSGWEVVVPIHDGGVDPVSLHGMLDGPHREADLEHLEVLLVLGVVHEGHTNVKGLVWILVQDGGIEAVEFHGVLDGGWGHITLSILKYLV